jgi:hypothetical protein
MHTSAPIPAPALSLDIPAPHVENEMMPLLEPNEQMSAETQSFFQQLPHELKVNGFGYYMNQVENEFDLFDYQFYSSYLAVYYYFHCFKEICSFTDWVNQVQSKVGGFRPDADVQEILTSVTYGTLNIIDAARQLFTRNQLVYYGW